jgi:hypothetical protein
MPTGFCVQEDNVMLEWNIPVCDTPNKFSKAMAKARTIWTKVLDADKYDVLYCDAAHFNPEYLQSRQAQTFGCDPDRDAYQGGAVRTMPENIMSNWRTAGGHIHIGADFQCPDFVVALFCDLFIGVNTGVLNQGKSKRTDWYGKPGIYRSKEYGIEYRTPSPIWASNADYTQYISHGAWGLAKWLSESDAAEIQRAFSAINWRQVHAYLSFTGSPQGSRSADRRLILNAAKKAGVPL